MTGLQVSYSFVRANIAPHAGPEGDEFLTWWGSEHQPEWVGLAGFRRGWLLERIDGESGELGLQPQRYAAVYEIDSAAAFNAALGLGQPWGPWQRFVDDWLVDWTRTYYDGASSTEASTASAPFWATVSVDVDVAENDLRLFERWYDEQHIPELLQSPGLHRARRHRRSNAGGQLGALGTRYLTVYEIDHPNDFAAARDARRDRGIMPWSPWHEHVRNFAVSFFAVRQHTDPEGTKA